MVAILLKIKNKAFCKDCDHDHNPNKEDRDHDRNPNKEDRDHGRSPIKTQKYDIFVRTKIYDRSPITTKK